MKRKLPITLVFVAVLTFIIYWGSGYFNNLSKQEKNANKPVNTTGPTASASSISKEALATDKPLLPEDISNIESDDTSIPLDNIPTSVTCLINRHYPLPENYVPKDLYTPNIPFSFGYSDDKQKLRKDAAKAIEKMFKAAKKKNLSLVAVSGYRSYERQKEIYNRNVSNRGKTETDTVSASPGSSEHQSGLAMDISCLSNSYSLTASFANTKEGKWVRKNAHKYGFIVRYEKNKENITGYHFEPWHIRYLGKNIATYLYKNNLSLEEYYGVKDTNNTIYKEDY